MTIRRIGAAFLLLGAAAPASGAEARFERVRELITAKCLPCHAADIKKGGLDLARREGALAGGEGGAAVVPGHADRSPLFERVAGGEMPPKNPLTPEQVEVFRAWIDAGAPYDTGPLVARRAGPDWWSLRPISRPEPPGVADAGWVRNPVDAFVLAKLEEQGLAPAPEADRATLIRRATFDLVGLPPTSEEVEAFADNPAPDAYEQLVNRLLDSPRYGERWGRHWLDVVRFGESNGYETNGLRPGAWPYRDYVIRAFNRDTPLPRFMLEQLAGDALPEGEADWLTRAATGFLVGGTHDVVQIQNLDGRKQQRMDDLDDMITATGTAFLGLTVQCSRCHDHKFDPIKQTDYYALQAVFAGVEHAEREIPAPDSERRRREAGSVRAELARLDRAIDDLEPPANPDASTPTRSPVRPGRNVERFAPTVARALRFVALATNNGIEPCLDELQVFSTGDDPRNVALDAAASASSEYPNAAIHKIAHLNDGLFGNSHSWIAATKGEGWAEVRWAEPTAIDRLAWGRDREGKFLDRLPVNYRVEVEVEPGRWRVVASSADRTPMGAEASAVTDPGRAELIKRRQGLEERLASLAPTVRVYAGTFAQPGPTHLLRRGDAMRPGDEVAPGGLSSVRPALAIAADAPEARRRLELARWLGHPENPLPARVMANRAWQHHFGRGLVNTPSDFGYNGGTPSHPELIDRLADEYRANGYHLKPLHRLIMLSATYRQSSRADPKGLAVDREDRWLWRMAPRRLEAEPIRDAILAVSGGLDLKMGGPGYSIWEKNTNYVAVYTPVDSPGPETFRRMIYQLKPRTQQDPTFGAFDCPDAALIAPRRNVSTTAIQALNLFNGRFILDRSRAFAARLAAEAGPEPAAQARRAFGLAFGRVPSEIESAAAAALIRDHGAPAFCRAIFNANEFISIR